MNAPEPGSAPLRPFPSLDIAEFDLQTRLNFLDLSELDTQRLHSLRATFAAYADEFVESFYHHLFAFNETSRFLHDPALVTRLKRLQRDYFESMLEGDWNEAYVAGRRLVGQTHAEIGIEPAVFLGAYNQYVQLCFKRFASGLDAVGHEELDRLLSVFKAIFLDVGLTLEAYFLQSTRSLRHALDMYWRANDELKQFAQLASHDLKTPLATVANLCDEALDEFGDQMPEGARKLIEAARQRTYRMSTLIDELLTSAVPPDGVDAQEEVSCTAILADVIDRLRRSLDAKGILLVVAPDLPMVWGNRVRLREAFYNILSNAVKFVDKHPSQITIAAEIRDKECILSFADNGPGIPSDELKRVFVPFRRLPAHRDLPGSGLGLYFTKSLVEHEGGRIWAESELGQGSCFYVALKRGP
jgi:signal transduction histidine kinase